MRYIASVMDEYTGEERAVELDALGAADACWQAAGQHLLVCALRLDCAPIRPAPVVSPALETADEPGAAGPACGRAA